MAERKLVVWTSLHCRHGSGSWAVVDGILTVRTPDGVKTAQIGYCAPEPLACVLMSELAQDI